MGTPFNTAGDRTNRDVDRLTLVNGRSFTVSDRNGEIVEPTHGTVFEDLRMLSKLTISVHHEMAAVKRQHLARSTPNPFHMSVVSRPDPSASESTPNETYIHRQWIGRGTRHDMEVVSFLDDPIEREIIIEFDTDFAHIFDVKNGIGSDRTSALTWFGTSGRLVDADDPEQAVIVSATPPPDGFDVAAKTLRWSVTCPPRGSVVVSLSFEPAWDGAPAGLLFPLDAAPAVAVPARQLEHWNRCAPSIDGKDGRLSQTVDTCLSDLASLRIFDPRHPDRVVIAAGAPWFMTLFGRDSLLTAWMMMPFAPELVVGVLRELAVLQGRTERAENEEQPGKILHELRRRDGDQAFEDRGRYYGTVDATPLFVMVAGEAERWGHLTTSTLRELWPNICAAIEWIERAIACDPTGFLRYERSTSTGLANQGWKDSWDGVTFADGRLPTGAIALCEVQGYAFAALHEGARLARRLDDGRLDPDALAASADRLRLRFEDAFWDEAKASYALGLTDDSTLIDSVTTNPGHAVWSGITDDDRAGRYLDRILDDDLWTGWGLRTLSPTCRAYNPLSYHNGSVWPHDTAIVTAGASRCGRFDAVDRLIDGALDAAARKDGRPPELFAGIGRDVIDTPVDYPDSCSPQAWSSASMLLNVRSSLGLSPGEHPADPPLVLRPRSTGAGMQFDVLRGVRHGPDRSDVVREDDRSIVVRAQEKPPRSDT